MEMAMWRFVAFIAIALLATVAHSAPPRPLVNSAQSAVSVECPTDFTYASTNDVCCYTGGSEELTSTTCGCADGYTSNTFSVTELCVARGYDAQQALCDANAVNGDFSDVDGSSCGCGFGTESDGDGHCVDLAVACISTHFLYSGSSTCVECTSGTVSSDGAACDCTTADTITVGVGSVCSFDCSGVINIGTGSTIINSSFTSCICTDTSRYYFTTSDQTCSQTCTRVEAVTSAGDACECNPVGYTTESAELPGVCVPTSLCPTAQGWSSDDLKCEACAADTYSTSSSVICSSCPEGSLVDSSQSGCECDTANFWYTDPDDSSACVCNDVSFHYYSGGNCDSVCNDPLEVVDSTRTGCECATGYTLTDGTCVKDECPAGELWVVASEACGPCGTNRYSLEGQNFCSFCDGTNQESNAAKDGCQCISGTFGDDCVEDCDPDTEVITSDGNSCECAPAFLEGVDEGCYERCGKALMWDETTNTCVDCPENSVSLDNTNTCTECTGDNLPSPNGGVCVTQATYDDLVAAANASTDDVEDGTLGTGLILGGIFGAVVLIGCITGCIINRGGKGDSEPVPTSYNLDNVGAEFRAMEEGLRDEEDDDDEEDDAIVADECTPALPLDPKKSSSPSSIAENMA